MKANSQVSGEEEGHGWSPPEHRVERVRVSAFVIPTEQPESDGSLIWSSTTMIVVEIEADGTTGLGYTYAHEAAALLIRDTFAPLLEGKRISRHRQIWETLITAVRNSGVEGLAATAISAVDIALWDLRARLLDLPLTALLGRVRDSVPVYGSGGFTSYDDPTLAHQLQEWVEQGIGAVKMKVGRRPERDLARVQTARRAIGNDAALMVDANNAYHPRQAVEWAHRFADSAGVVWLEQPVPQDNVEGMQFVRDHAPAAMAIADGEYGYTSAWFYRRLQAGAADVFVPDITRCLGLTGFLRIAALCEAADIPMSSHCAPSLHAAVGCAVGGMRHCEYFYDHVRIEQAVFGGAARADRHGCIAPNENEPGFGLVFRREEAERMTKRAASTKGEG